MSHRARMKEKNGPTLTVEQSCFAERTNRIVDVSLDMSSKAMKGNYTCRSGSTGLFADPSSCSIYHWCNLGVLQSSHYCNLGLHFSASASGCVLPKDAECMLIVRIVQCQTRIRHVKVKDK
jgi:hypothetical protein